MRLACLCPTFRRPDLLANSLALFELQSHPDKYLLILDDGGTFANQEGKNWRLVSTPERVPSMPEKYNLMLSMLPDEWEGAVVWDDDDLYFPDHMAACNEALELGELSRPRYVMSDYTRQIVIEPTAGRFYASMAARRSLIERTGGWVKTSRLDFDQMMIALWTQNAEGVHDPYANRDIQFCYRWNHPFPNVSGLDPQSWYEQAGERWAVPDYRGALKPALDLWTQYALQQAGFETGLAPIELPISTQSHVEACGRTGCESRGCGSA
jgi:hypothetical protein